MALDLARFRFGILPQDYNTAKCHWNTGSQMRQGFDLLKLVAGDFHSPGVYLLATYALSPLLTAILRIAPPPPAISVTFMFLGIPLTYFAAFQVNGNLLHQQINRRIRSWGAAAVAFALIYAMAFDLYTFEIPTTKERIVLGCGFTQNALLLAPNYNVDPGDACPGNYENLLASATYNNYEIWSKKSIAAVTLILASAWIGAYLCFSFVVALLAIGSTRGTFLAGPGSGPEESVPIAGSTEANTSAASPEVFIAYARRDRLRALRIVEALKETLEDSRVTIWWDSEIEPGETWDQAIDAALNRALCVVVLWSQHSVRSTFVREEALHALRRHSLIPVLIDPIEPPYGHKLLRTGDLANWNGDLSDPEFRKLRESILRHSGKGLDGSPA